MDFIKRVYGNPGLKERRTSVVREKTIKVKQLVTGMFLNPIVENCGGGGSYCIIALSEDGKVYRYDTGCMGWFPLPMKTTTGCEHRR